MLFGSLDTHKPNGMIWDLFSYLKVLQGTYLVYMSMEHFDSSELTIFSYSEVFV